MKRFKSPFLLALIFFAAANIVFFWKFYFRGLLPFPGNLLVSYYFPWNGGGFAGFDPWTTRKAVIGMDVIRQMYPWRTLGNELLKSGFWPLWNPYNFSGAPLLANLQSSFFFPLNLITSPLPPLAAWVSQVILLPFLLSLSGYLFLRSLKLSNFASIFGAVSLAGISFLSVWSEQIMVTQSILSLPLTLWAINSLSETKKRLYLLLIPVFLALSIFGGHIQTAAYVFILSLAYALFKRLQLRQIVFVFVSAILISSVQLLPSLELYLNSARDNPAQRQFITATALPLQNLVTVFAPDFFGNPATNNFRQNNYDNSLAYGGIIVLVLASLAFFRKKTPSEIRFWGIAALGSLLFSLPPLAYILSALHIPILGTSYLSRATFIFEISLVILGAYGFEQFIAKPGVSKPKVWPVIVLLAGIYMALWIIAFRLPVADRGVTLRNLLIPTSLFFLTAVSLFLNRTKLRLIIPLILIAAAIFETGYFFNKYQPFAKSALAFPQHPVFSFLQQHAGFDRYFGLGPAYIDSNFATYYRVFTPEGYDPLYPSRYSQFVSAAANKGILSKSIPPSDAVIGNPDQFYLNRLLDVLGVKYIVDKTDSPDVDKGQNFAKFPASDYVLTSQIRQWKFYQRYSALPRVFLAGQFEVIPDPAKNISTIYDKSFDPGKTLLLEEQPATLPENGGSGVANITSYSPNSVTITTQSEKPKLLFLSDNFYPGWQALIDGQPAKVYRADYTFRAVGIPAGKHTVMFAYQPLSFTLGLLISAATILLLCGKYFYWHYSR